MLPCAGDYLKTYQKSAIVYLDEQLDSWLNGKTEKGYKKAAFIRHVLTQQMLLEQQQKRG